MDPKITPVKGHNISTTNISLSIQDSNSPTSKPSINYASFYKYLKGSLNDLIITKIEDYQNSVKQCEESKMSIDNEQSSNIVKVIKCRICKSGEETKNNLIIDSCLCENSYKYVHVKCLKDHLQKRIFEEFSKNFSIRTTENQIEDKPLTCCFQCDKCKYEYRIMLKTQHNFHTLKKFYENESKLSFVRDMSIFFYFLFMVIANLIGLIYVLVNLQISPYICYLCVSLMLFLCALALSFSNLLEKMEESVWVFAKKEAGFYPLKEYLIYLEKKKKNVEEE